MNDIHARVDDLIDEIEEPIDNFAVYELIERLDPPKSQLGYIWRKVRDEYERALADGNWDRAEKLRSPEAIYRRMFTDARSDLGSDPQYDYEALDAHLESLMVAPKASIDRVIRTELKRLRANAD